MTASPPQRASGVSSRRSARKYEYSPEGNSSNRCGSPSSRRHQANLASVPRRAALARELQPAASQPSMEQNGPPPFVRLARRAVARSAEGSWPDQAHGRGTCLIDHEPAGTRTQDHLLKREMLCFSKSSRFSWLNVPPAPTRLSRREMLFSQPWLEHLLPEYSIWAVLLRSRLGLSGRDSRSLTQGDRRVHARALICGLSGMAEGRHRQLVTGADCGKVVYPSSN